MTDALVFRVLFVCVFVGLWITRGYYVRKTRDPATPRSREERRAAMKREGWTGIALVVLTPVELLLILLYLIDPIWMSWANIEFPETVRWIGFILTALSIPLAAWVHHALGRHYSYALETKEDQSIVTIGPYSRIRHPLYSVHTLFNSGMILLTANIPLILFAIIGVPFTYARMKSEEAMMKTQFGEEYVNYMMRTGRIFPKIKQPSSKQTKA